MREILLGGGGRNPALPRRAGAAVHLPGLRRLVDGLPVLGLGDARELPAAQDGIHEEIKRAFDERGIEIPFPHRTLYAGSPTEPLPVRIVDPATAAATAPRRPHPGEGRRMNWKERLGDNALFDVRLFEISGTPVTVATLAVFVLVLLATLWIARLLHGLFMRTFTARGQQNEGSIAASARLIRYGVWVTGLAVAVHSLGINLTALFAAGAVFAVGHRLRHAEHRPELRLRRDPAGRSARSSPATCSRSRAGWCGSSTWASAPRSPARSTRRTSSSPTRSWCHVGQELHPARLRFTGCATVVGVIYSSDMAQVRHVLEAAADQLAWRSPDETPRVLLIELRQLVGRLGGLGLDRRSRGR